MTIKTGFNRLLTKWRESTPVTRGFVVIILIVIIGIIVRWRFIIDEACNGFKYFSK
jgi:hypothetical protein